MKLLSNKEKLVCSRIHREYNKFQYHVLRMKKEEIMNRCCKIRFYDCIKEYFQYNVDISVVQNIATNAHQQTSVNNFANAINQENRIKSDP